jgi:choline dehydrogenase
VRVAAEGVGRNLQDRYEVGVVYEVDRDFSILDGCTFGAPGDPCIRDWQRARGPYGTNGTTTAIVHRSAHALTADPDLFVFGAAGFFRGYYPGYSAETVGSKHHFTWAILKAHTGNDAGRITLRSTDPRVRPRIEFHYFDEGRTDGGQDEADLEAVVEGMELVRAMAPRIDSAIIGGGYREVFPGPEVDTHEELRAAVQDHAWGHHASCTARMGAEGDPNAVLDSRFRVNGVDGLRVVDASVFPNIPGFFIVVPVYMVSEKATDTILADYGEL